MPLLTIVPPMPGAERRFKPFVDFVQAAGWEAEFVRLDWTGRQPNFDSTTLFPQVDAQTAGKVVMGFSLGAVYAHLRPGKPLLEALREARTERIESDRTAGRLDPRSWCTWILHRRH